MSQPPSQSVSASTGPSLRSGSADLPAATVRHRTVEIDEVEIFYREAGPQDAPAIVLLHGLPTSSHTHGVKDASLVSPDTWRKFRWHPGARPADHPGLSDLDL